MSSHFYRKLEFGHEAVGNSRIHGERKALNLLRFLSRNGRKRKQY